MLFLTRPDAVYRDTYLDALREYQAEGRHLEVEYVWVARYFDDYVASLREREDTRRLPMSWVPETYFWLIDGADYIGTTRLRHHLTDRLRAYGGNIGYEIRPSKRLQGYGKQILKLALVEARRIGLKRALVTCNRENTGSRKIIEANGGVFEGEDAVKINGAMVHERRYWIEIPRQDAPS